ncbi:hypothetical protein GOV14_04940 [Candidatus Pacearchaeota archaeon]|nr:hypothetical protein [Candidatus Pacearchaeota archaeon]
MDRKKVILIILLIILAILIILNATGLLDNFWKTIFNEKSTNEFDSGLGSLGFVKGDGNCVKGSRLILGGELTGGYFKLLGNGYWVKEGSLKNNGAQASVYVNGDEAMVGIGESGTVGGLLVYVLDINSETESDAVIYYADLILGENEVSSPQDCK